ncbi:hypothetical protein vseg_020253 [Gypsophila vaccaria]
MAPEVQIGSDNQPRNQQSEDNQSAVSYHDHSTASGSSTQHPSSQYAQYISGSRNAVQSGTANSGASLEERSLVTVGGSLSEGPGFSRVAVSGPSRLDLSSVQGPQFSVTAQQSSIPPQNQRPVTMQRVSRLPNNMSACQGVESQCYNDHVIASRMLQQQQNSFQQQCYSNQQPQNPYQQQQNPFQQQQNPFQQQQNSHQQQQNSFQQQRNPHQQQQNLYQQPQNMYQQPQSAYQQQQNPHQQMFCTAVPPQQVANTVITAARAVKRLTSYLRYQRPKPQDNNILYWRSFVRHYYSPQVKRITCFSKYAHSRNHVAQLELWSCEICGCTPGKGLVETYDVLPRLHHLYFNSSGVVDEIMFLDYPTEKRLPNGSLMLRYGKAVKESIYKHCHVVHEGTLQVVFTPQLQILSWNFCVQNHEVLLSRKLIKSQVNNLIKDATSCKSDDDANRHDKVQVENLSSNGNRVEDAARKLAAMVKQPHLTDSGLSKHFVFSLQVSDVFNSMKDLMDFSLINNISPIETLKRYDRNSAGEKLETNYMDCRPSMPQTAGLSERRKFPAQNSRLTGKTDHTFQMASCTLVNNKKPMYNSVSRYQKPPLTEQMTPHMCASIALAQSSYGPLSARISPQIEQFMLNDLLGHMQRQGTQQTKRKRSEELLQGRAPKKSRLGCSQVKNALEAGPSHILDGKAENGKGLISSSDSNSSRMLTDGSTHKKTTDLDEDDFTSSDQTRRSLKNSNNPQ